MDINYLKDQIQDELNGYEDYLNKSETCPEFSDTFRSMAEQEMGHAKNLLNMLKKIADESVDLYKQYSERIH